MTDIQLALLFPYITFFVIGGCLLAIGIIDWPDDDDDEGGGTFIPAYASNGR